VTRGLPQTGFEGQFRGSGTHSWCSGPVDRFISPKPAATIRSAKREAESIVFPQDPLDTRREESPSCRQCSIAPINVSRKSVASPPLKTTTFRFVESFMV